MDKIDLNQVEFEFGQVAVKISNINDHEFFLIIYDDIESIRCDFDFGWQKGAAHKKIEITTSTRKIQFFSKGPAVLLDLDKLGKEEKLRRFMTQLEAKHPDIIIVRGNRADRVLAIILPVMFMVYFAGIVYMGTFADPWFAVMMALIMVFFGGAMFAAGYLDKDRWRNHEAPISTFTDEDREHWFSF